MSLKFEMDLDCFWILPVLAVGVVECQNCEEQHGFAIVAGWFVFNVYLLFGADDHE